ncbi:unknown [Gryllus bimaculatus nudivirus]|uniref:Uncharacterized protein n=1 Tax=Gryllus bimaculatus nudivirus TaxID=432587 RepID=A4L249_9VIRU|nr:hypothetical protein GrBNV_gp86 [Gryllus bimaculatus nudivirus]ABO45419.1 unknown [Gryllus bimaculatus nudivirus]
MIKSSSVIKTKIINTLDPNTQTKRKNLRILKNVSNVQGPIKYVFLVKTFGCYLLLCVNEHYEIIKTYISEKCINVFNGTYIHKNQFGKRIMKYKPEIIYTNSGEIIKDIITLFKVVVCENPIRMHEIMRNESKEKIEKTKKIYNKPSFDNIRELDNTITYKEYIKIFEK